MLKSPTYFARSIYFLELSFIELLMAIFIVGITLAMGVPNITSMLYRAQFSTEAVGLISDLRNQTAIYYAHHGQLPQQSQQIANIKTEGKYINNIRLQEGIIIAEPKAEFSKFDPPAQQITFQSVLLNSSSIPFISWQCGANTTHHTITTTLPNQYLPHVCRSAP